MISIPTQKSEGIVLSTVRYGETQKVVNILTRENGRMAYMVSGNGKRSAGRAAMLMPLSGLDFIASGSGKRAGMKRISEMYLRRPLNAVLTDPIRRSEAFFMAELLCHALPENVPDETLYDYVEQSIVVLERGPNGLCNFHLYFMMHLMDYIGIAPDHERSGQSTFDMAEGRWSSQSTTHPHVLTGQNAELWHNLALTTFDGLAQLSLNRNERQELIGMMSDYYRLHQPGFGTLHSQEILAMLN